MPVKWIARIIAALNSNSRPGEIAAGISFGFLLALQPGMTVFRILLLVLLFFLKVNLGAAFLSLFLFSLLSPLLDPPLDLLGGWILTLTPLRGVFEYLYNLPLVPYTRFYNTIVAGGLAAGILLWLPVYFAARSLVVLYRTRLRDRLAEHPAMRAVLKLPIVSTLARFVGRAVSLSRNF